MYLSSLITLPVKWLCAAGAVPMIATSLLAIVVAEMQDEPWPDELPGILIGSLVFLLAVWRFCAIEIDGENIVATRWIKSVTG